MTSFDFGRFLLWWSKSLCPNGYRVREVQHHTSMKRGVYIFFPCKALKCASLPLRSSFLQFQGDPLRWQWPCLLNTIYSTVRDAPRWLLLNTKLWTFEMGFTKFFLSLVLWFWGSIAMTTPNADPASYTLFTQQPQMHRGASSWI